ncbi:sodium:solute symporter [Aliiglaciecola sp. CAU 1673]|uniref:sodium:solute symporter n=1 Tax=Aliiglaciecola sp. CAU 1673 TaxID=3032595 RepID=UPI0023DB114B|nr:sodium:solute symporter [Aliiglaciecola sp. CAU 1673]MDF2176673.1 sodium:solute symporter [Aliiglaciecola sp. CAU 1673]
MESQFAWLDWTVFAAYALLMLGSGWYFSRRQAASSREYFLAGNQMPVWMVAISVLATSQSAATFLGGPEQGYRSDLSYLATNIGAMIAALLVAYWLIPKFYALRVTTVYELLEQRFGAGAKSQASLLYLFGRVFASGARLFMAALALAMILFNDIHASSVLSALLVLTLVGLLYSLVGGIRSVIYSDVIHCALYVGAALLVLGYLFMQMPLEWSQMLSALEHPLDRELSKFTLIDTRLDFGPGGVFSLWSALTGFVLLNIAAFGLDQDMTQRMLSCKDARQGAKALLWSVVWVIPVMLVFILIGLLLYLFYQRPDLMGSASGLETPSFEGEPIGVFMYYVLNELPAGLKGLVAVGVIAAALSTLNSGLNAMSSVLVEDLYRPWRARRGALPEKHYVRAGQWGMVIAALALCAMAALCFYWQRYSDMPLLAFALSVMVFSYSGLLGVYFTALFTHRGSPASVAAALATGFLFTLAMQPYLMAWYLPAQWQFELGFSWQLCLGALVATMVCLMGKSPQSERRI